MDTLSIIENAINSKEKLMVVYLGGSQPGAVREIAPLSIKNGKVRARCYMSNVIKTFLTEKIQIMDSDGALTETNYTQDEVYPLFHSYYEVYEYLKQRLLYLGWHVTFTSDSISVHKKFKNGNPRKTSEVSIYFDEYTSEMFADWDSEGSFTPEVEVRKKKKPYMFSAKNEQTCGFKTLEKSVRKFVKFSELLAPNK
ncbi:hypothetical protein N473_04030 [Pseudoalteromonas luteoviolacea CPMOR-1]|uniref:Uncharacterized protein n=1 Tax=Pseudoalteromonas luteoviolacea CPMOR-1 TaxID=1365248 RepID=A0A167IGQ3_9GAMM|nr:hypothetical protein [Pseudoalteromonas luteoviolacea]KZN59339.1 hypothetical protein N473_04030 [Pseudoalteromonas luteoviolacea CPMOR-1]